VKAFEVTMASVLALLGLRSLLYWIRRPLDSRSLRDHLLYAAWMTGRVGLWFAVAGIFAISALIGREGRAFSDEFQRYRWYFFVPLGLAIVQLVTSLVLARSRSD
jgi:hypothetical protein